MPPAPLATNGSKHVTTQLLTTLGLVVSLLFIIVDKAFLQIGSNTSRIEIQVQALTQTALDNKQRIAALEELALSLRALPQAVATQTEAITTLKDGVKDLRDTLTNHVARDSKREPGTSPQSEAAR